MMIVPRPQDAIHKAWLYRILEAIADDEYLPKVLYFKGGTCASMLGWLDRFSVDLDFDYAAQSADIPRTRTALQSVFAKLGLAIKDFSKTGLQYFLKYDNAGRNTIVIDVSFPLLASSTYEPQRFIEIDRVLNCQTQETMVAHKLVVLIERFEKTKHIAGRDVYDIDYFFMHGYRYNPRVIEERRSVSVTDFFNSLVLFIEKEVTDDIITQDLNTLLPLKKFSSIRKTLKQETLMLLRDEIKRLTASSL